jgi:hypothetical protein
MEKNTTTKAPPFFVSAATVAGNLIPVMDIAKEISLAAKNANAIAERAGEKANSFRPITDYINEMGNETILLINTINTGALEVSRISVNELRANEIHQKLIVAQEYAGKDAPASIQKLIDNAAENVTEHKHALKIEKDKLIELLTEIKTQMLASAVISTCSRVEATQAEEHEASLEAVAQNVDTATKKIASIVKECDALLN